MSSGLYSGVSGLALGTGLYKGAQGLWGGSSGLVSEFGATLSLNFLAGAPLDSRITFSRTTNATLVDSTGRVTYAPNNLSLYSEQFDNAVYVKVRSSITSNATNSPNGTTTADKLVEDTTATSTHLIQLQGGFSSFVSGTTYVISGYAKAGERTSASISMGTDGGVFAGQSANFNFSTGVISAQFGVATFAMTDAGNGWYRWSIAATPAASGAAFIRFQLIGPAGSNSYTGDGTSGLFIWGAQLEAVTYQTLPSTYVQTVASAYYGPRFDYNPVTLAPRGLLIEEQRVNSIRNSIGVGAVAGTPGTAPTTWALTGSGSPVNGISMHIVGTGAENGISYVDVRVFGTNTAAGTQYVDVTYDITNATAAQNQSWTLSSYYRLLSGNFTGFTSVSSIIYGSPLFNDNASVSITSVTNAPLIQQRLAVTRTFALVTTTGASPRLAFTVNIGATVDVTVRIGLPQLELGAFATSVIPTATAQVTRAADVAVMTGTNFSSWYNASEGTFVASAAPIVSAVAKYPFSVSDGTSNELIAQYFINSNAGLFVNDGGIGQAQIEVGTFSGVSQVAVAYQLNNFAISLNGGSLNTDTSGTVPTVTQAQIGNRASGDRNMNGHIRTLTYYPQRLADAQLQALSA